VDDLHRWDRLPQRGGGWTVAYKGTLDVRGERLELASVSETPNPPLVLHFRATGFLSSPHWEASADLNQIPIAAGLEAARHMGAAFPEKLAAEGSVSGALRYRDTEGPSGRVEMQHASLTLPDAEPLLAESAAVAIDGQAVALEPSTVRVGENQSAEVEGRYTLSGGALDLKITTRGLNAADMHRFGLVAIPVLEHASEGTWRGSARYHWTPPGAGEWSGTYELQNARVPLDGLAEPVRIQSATVNLNGTRALVSRLRASAGAIAFTGDYRWEPGAARPHRFHIAVAEADAAELARLWAPTLRRERGFLARTLRLGTAPLPDWLKSGRGDGTVAVASLTVGDTKIRGGGSARLLWDERLVRLAGVSARWEQTSLAGDLEADLSGRTPHYRFDGKLRDVPYRGGRLDFDGGLESAGAGANLLSSLRGAGRLHGRLIGFGPDADFRSVASCFEIVAARLRLSDLEVTEGQDTYFGQAATQADGRLLVELNNRGGNRTFTVATR
jgi:hypothetical protein